MTEKRITPVLRTLLAASRAAISGSWKRNYLSVLIFHRVLPAPDPLIPDEMTIEQFRARLRLLCKYFRVLPLVEGLRQLRDGTLPPKTVTITFDDGYRDNATVVLPLLQEQGLKATFFIASGYLNGGRMWNDDLIEIVRRWPGETLDFSPLGLGVIDVRTLESRRRALGPLLRQSKALEPSLRAACLRDMEQRLPGGLPTDLMMTDAQVRQLYQAGMEIGGHTRTHPILKQITLEAARAEIVDGREDLQRIIDAPVRFFAFPNGIPHYDYDAHHVELVQSLGFEAAFSTSWGAATAESDFFQLPRFTPWDKSLWLFGLRLILSRRTITYPVA
ncbi:polysaccharide deacetylase family protein [Candidatus Contendibacter odensensis]